MDRKTRFEDWLAQNIALVCFVVFGGGAVIAILAAVAFSDAATTSHPEGDEFGGVGVRSIHVSGPIDQAGHYTTRVVTKREISPQRARRAGEYDQEFFGYLPTKDSNCWVGGETIVFNSALGTDIATTKNNMMWCGNGNKVTYIRPIFSCKVPAWVQAGSGWHLDNGGPHLVNFFRPWQGSAQGSQHQRLSCEYWQTIFKNHWHRSEIVGTANGRMFLP